MDDLSRTLRTQIATLASDIQDNPELNPGEGIEALLAQIKQAFAAETALLRLMYLAEVDGHKRTKAAFIDIHDKYRNSGQEFYDRLLHELDLGGIVATRHIDAAAKRAAGLERNE